jgi:hypothetical protein
MNSISIQDIIDNKTSVTKGDSLYNTRASINIMSDTKAMSLRSSYASIFLIILYCFTIYTELFIFSLVIKPIPSSFFNK